MLLASNGLWMLPTIQQLMHREFSIINLSQHVKSRSLRDPSVFDNGLCNFLMEFNTIFLDLYNILNIHRGQRLWLTVLYSRSLSSRVTKSFKYIGVHQVLGGEAKYLMITLLTLTQVNPEMHIGRTVKNNGYIVEFHKFWRWRTYQKNNNLALKPWMMRTK